MTETNKKNLIKGNSPRGDYSRETITQILKGQEVIRLDEQIQDAQLLDDILRDLPSHEDLQAKIDRLAEQMKKDLEEYLGE